MLPAFEQLQTGMVLAWAGRHIPVVEAVYYAGTRLIGKDSDRLMDVYATDVFRITGFIPDTTRFLVRVTDRQTGSCLQFQSMGTTYTLEYDKVKEFATIISMVPDKDYIDPDSIRIGRTLHLDHLFLDEMAPELLAYLDKSDFRDLRRLAMYGVKFIVFDMYEHKSKSGKLEEVVEITATLGEHGFWVFPKKHLPKLIKQWAI